MSQNDLSMGQDSFLDIVANLVGILIILVVVVGAQATTSWQVIPTSDEQLSELQAVEEATELKSLEAINLQKENAELHSKLDYEQQISQRLAGNRHQLLVAIEGAKESLASKKQVLDTQQSESHDLLASVEKLKHEIQLVRYEFSAVEHQESSVETIEHYPTPIARTVFSDEIHFQIKDGRIAYVPMDELVSAMKNEWKVQARKLASAENTWENVGPIGDFRLHYLLGIARGKNNSLSSEIRFQRFEIHATSRIIGEEINVALREGSDFKSRLERMLPQKTTVSLWVFPKDYQNLIEIRNWLRQHHFQIASWPLKDSQPIGGGPQGFRTSTN